MSISNDDTDERMNAKKERTIKQTGKKETTNAKIVTKFDNNYDTMATNTMLMSDT